MSSLHPVLTSLTDAGMTTAGEAALFWVVAPVIVLAALGLLFARKAVHAAMSVVLVMVGLAVLYIAQDAPFLGVVQIVVYTGAIMMLFVFVLMLVGVDASDSLTEQIAGQRWIAALASIGLGTVLVTAIVRSAAGPARGVPADAALSNPEALARIVFGDYVFALEIVGALLVTAALGALVLTHRRRLLPRRGQKERADARVAAGARLTPLAAPGVYARHNAMDTPALDPQGQPIEESVSRVLRIRGQELTPKEASLSGLTGPAASTDPVPLLGPGAPAPTDSAPDQEGSR